MTQTLSKPEFTTVELNPDDCRITPLLKEVNFHADKRSSYRWFGVLHDDKLVGVGALAISRVGWNIDGNLYCGTVTKEYRGLGIHGLLLDARVKAAKDAGANQVFVRVSRNNTPCKNSLIKAGFGYYDHQGLERWYIDVSRVC